MPPGRDEMKATFQAFRDVQLACYRNPPGCDRAALEQLAEDGPLTRTLAIVDDGVANGVIGVATERPTYFVFLVIHPSDDGTSGVVEICDVNGDTAIKLNDPANAADDEIVDDRLFSHHARFALRVVDGRWQVVASTNVEVWEGVNNCPPPGS